ncbi:LysE family translocator [Comamonas odontotermitis]|uniref:LysE family translocator n=1 Tax=Comamonas odontotermitis TaxID=379895 RepID=UPI0037516A4F
MEWLAVISITILAVISPGPDFAMVTRCSLLYGKRIGMLVAWGIALGVQVHVCYSMLGVAWLMQHSPAWFTAFKLVGAAYLVWVGWQTLHSTALPAAADGPEGNHSPAQTSTIGPWAAVRAGFFTNALNPKTTLFVVSVFSQVVQPGAPSWVLVSYGLFISVAHGAWFTAVACVLATPAIRNRVLQKAQWLNRGIGAVLMAMGIALALAR